MTDENAAKPNIVTINVYPPIPIRNHDWYARFEWDDGDTPLSGHGETEADAVLMLLQNAVDDDVFDGEPQEEVVDMAFAHWNAILSACPELGEPAQGFGEWFKTFNPTGMVGLGVADLKAAFTAGQALTLSNIEGGA